MTPEIDEMLWTGQRLAAAVALAVLLCTHAAAAAEKSPGDKTLLLSEKHYWRKQYTFIPPKVSVQAAKANGLPTDAASRAKYLARFYFTGIQTPPPPPDWVKPDFDDSAWRIARGRQFHVGDRRVLSGTPIGGTDVYLRGTDSFVEEVGLICHRAAFKVNDPAKVKALTLSLTYRGGFVAYLNGSEVARAHLPAGPITPDTAADDYPLEAHFERDTIGKSKLRYLSVFNRQWKPARDSDQWALRERSFGPKQIKLDALAKGVNVLAIELHRADYPAEAKQKVNWRAPRSLGWATVGMSLMGLRAEADKGAVESLSARAGGLQIWTEDVGRPVGQKEVPATAGPPRPIRIVGARNGSFAGQVIVRRDRDLKGISAAVGELSHNGGEGKIPASAVTIRYGAVNPTRCDIGVDYFTAVLPMDMDLRRGLGSRFDALLDAPPPGAWTIPVWMTVKVPGDVPGGDYTGRLTVKIPGVEPVTVPIELHLADWTLPDVKDYGSLVNIYQSPATLANYYKVAPWSGEHWRLIEKSLKLMGEVGNIGLFFPLLAESQMGNPESWVVWSRQADGSYTYDFRIFDRYLETALKHHDRLRFLCMNVWGTEADPRRNQPTVTVLDPATGAKSNMQLPAYGTPECEALWRPVLRAVKKRLAARGLDKLMLLGLPADQSPHWKHVAMFHRIVPGVSWARESHFKLSSFRYDVKDPGAKVPVAYNSIVWAPAGGVPDPTEDRYYGWQVKPAGPVIMNFNRLGTCTVPLLGFPAPYVYRQWMDSTLVLGRRGNGRVGGDYWHMGEKFVGTGRISSEASGGSRGTRFGIYLKSAVGQVGLGNTTTDLFAPGPEGPVTSVRFENAREGNQEAEARIFIEKALLHEANPLPAGLAKRCQDHLDARTNIARLYMLAAVDIGWRGWQASARKLYDLAAEVARTRKK